MFHAVGKMFHDVDNNVEKNLLMLNEHFGIGKV